MYVNAKAELVTLAPRRWLGDYTARNATDLMQLADFTDLMQVDNKLHQAC